MLTNRSARRRLVVLFSLVGAACLGALAGRAQAATVTKTSLAAGIPGFPTAPGGLGVFEALTPVPPPDAVREVGTYAVTVVADPAIPAEAPFAGAWKGYGVTDIRNHTDNGVAYPMVLQLAADAWAGEYSPEVAANLTWLLRNADALIAGEADANAAAAAIQVVVWQTLRNPQGNPPLAPRADLVNPTVDPAINTLAAKFTTLMQAGVAGDPNGAATISLATGALVGCTSTLNVTGTPGTPVVLHIDNGGVLSTQVVIIAADGTASATVQGVPGITVTVSGSVATGGVLVRADGAHDPDVHTTEANQSRAAEELIFLAGAGAANTSTPISCSALVPPVSPPVSPPPPGTTTGRSLGALSLTKTAPPTAISGQLITYRLRVRNTSNVAVESVVVRDVLPKGMSLVGTPAGATVKNGTVVWNVGTLAAGERKVLTLQVRLDRTIRGRRCNNATASGSNAPTVRARACSAVRAVAGAVRIPVVTG
jgi:uncharacterized repeat protein (TIGR01451 family)